MLTSNSALSNIGYNNLKNGTQTINRNTFDEINGTDSSVHLSGSISRPRRVICGVPQGSALGPLLFTLYTADIGIIVQSFGLKHHTYDDDNQIYLFSGRVCLLKDQTH